MSPGYKLQELVRQWLFMDPNPVSRTEIQNLWDSHQYDELEKRMSQRIDFGTAGLRGRMEAGWNRINDLVIMQTSQGFAEYVLKMVDGACGRGLVVGHDHRHQSEHWASLTAQVFIAKGLKVYILCGCNHTPLVPFAVQEVHAAGGVMITASHNPKHDNGYKVYWENAIQVISPHDKGISNTILSNLNPIPISSNIFASDLCIDITQELLDKYFKYLKAISKPCNISKPISFVNTSLHGVSDKYLKQAFITMDFPLYFPVLEQQLPDPNFPTLPFPNPEEKGALNLAILTANNIGANYILAQDPDADRFSAGEKSDKTNEWILFSGDQLGILFASKILHDYKLSGQPINKLAMIASTVSSTMVKKMAEIEGFKYVECLTGFKFIGNAAWQLSQHGYHVSFGYEEAIGYMFGSHVLDKDGIAATVQFVELVYFLQTQNKTVSDYLYELYDRYGHFKTNNGYFFCNELEIINKIFTDLRNYHGTQTYPKKLGGFDITQVVDLTIGYDSGNPPDYTPVLPLSSGNMIQFKNINHDENLVSFVLTLRTSGTEPKIKYYLEGSGRDQNQIQAFLLSAMVDIVDWIQVSKYNLCLV